MSLPCKFLISLNAKKKKIFCVLYGERKMVLLYGKRRLLLYTGLTMQVFGEEVKFEVLTLPNTRSIYCLDLSQLQLCLCRLHLCRILYGNAKIDYKFSSDTKINFPATHAFGFYVFSIYEIILLLYESSLIQDVKIHSN